MGLWERDGVFDFSYIEEVMRKITSADLDARVIVRVHLDHPGRRDGKYPGNAA